MRKTSPLRLWFCVVFFPCLLPAGADAATLYVGAEPGDYAAIQDAVAAAGTGDTVLIRSGAYIESVIIDNYATPGDSGSGARDRTGLAIREAPGASAAVISSLTYGDIFLVTANQVTIEGLDIFGTLDVSGHTSTTAIHLSGADGCTIRNNRCGWNATRKNGFGIYLSGNADSNTVQGNTCSHNTGLGIYLHGSSRNLILGNICENVRNYYGTEEGIRLYASTYNTLSGNTCRFNPRGIELYYNNSYNTVAGNTCDSNQYGMYLYSDSYTMITGNSLSGNQTGIWQSASIHTTVAGNTVSGNTQYGIYLFNSSSDSRCFLNRLGNNPAGNLYLVGGTGNLLHASTMLSYAYQRTARKGDLGNFYDDYPGEDADGDGIGDTPYSGTTFTDDHPLAAFPSSYALKTWCLGDAVMVGNTLTGQGGACPVLPGSSVVWVADRPAPRDLTFPAGATGDQTGWTYQLIVEEFWQSPSLYLTLTLGYADAAGAGFTSVGNQPATAPAAGSGQFLSGTFDNVQEFTVPSGSHLALRIENTHGANTYHVFLGGCWSYVSSSYPSPAYPVAGEPSAGDLTPVYPLLLE